MRLTALETSKKASYIPPLDAVLVVVVTVFITMFLGGAMYLLADVAITLVVGEALIAVPPLAYMLYMRVNIAEYVGLKVEPRVILKGLVLAFALLLLGLCVSAVISLTLGESEAVKESTNLLRELGQSPTGLLAAITTCVLAGICEEFTFRGFLQKSLSSKYSPKLAVLASSIAFSLLHFDPQGIYIILSFTLGVALSYAYHRWRSYTANATAHALYDLIALALALGFT
ncbi:MAG: type II CAAX endopeptidase family protein [Candidatus Bathyarchaeia archaeon]